MALKHDAQGFLTGDPIDIGRALKVWDDIHDDVRAIRRALTSGASGGPARPGRADKTGNEVARPMAPAPSTPRSSSQIPALLRKTATPQTGGASASAIRRDAQAVEVAGQAVAAVRAASQATQRAIAKPVSRDGRGRFVRGEGRGGSGAPGSGGGNGGGGGGDGEETGALRGVADRIAGAIRESGSGMEEADPAVKAMNEVARPMARGYELLTGGSREKRQEGWLRRIWTSLTGFRKDETTFNKAANKSLKNIEEKPDDGAKGGSGLLGGLFGGLGRALTRIPVVGGLLGAGGGLLKGAGRLLGFGGKEAAATSGAAKEAGLLGKAGGLLKEGGALSKMGGLLKRVPILGALLAGAGAAADVYSSESDDTLSRREKDKKTGAAVGGFAGSMAGMAAGAAGGAALGTLIFPGIGTAIGGAIGGAVGMFLGDDAGKILGDTVGGWVNDLRAADIPGMIGNAWNEVKVTALGTFDWVKSGWDSVVGSLQKGWDATMTAFAAVGDTIKKAWGGFVDTAKAGWESVSGAFASAYEGLKSLPGIGPAIKAAEAGARKIAEVAGAVKDGAVELGGKAADAVQSGASTAWNATKNAAGSAWSGAKDFAASMVPQGLKDRIAARRAMETGADYKQGNIAGLDDAHTRALVASTAATESAGGKLDVVNSAGYMGRYQAGAGWLADAGLIKGGSAAVQAAMKADGFSNEYKWGQAGGMSKFLKNADNWNGGMSYDKYLGSADAQDAAFKTNSDKSYARLLARGVIKEGMSQDEIAGILKARHIAGEGGAAKAARGESGPSDANGTSALKYKNDLAAGNIYAKAFAGPDGAPATPAAPARPSIASVAAPAAPVVASASAPMVPSAPSVPSVPEAPPVTVPMASNDSDKPIQVSMPSPDVGQDVRDRGIAHVATGGLSA